jgi:hypothetical protein
MVTSVCECYKCHYRFNYEFIPGSSFHSIRLGTKRIFRCPKCRTLQKFDLTKKGQDDSLKTYGDDSTLGIGVKLWVFQLVPTFILIFSGAFSFFIFIQPIYIHFFLILLGVIWIAFSLVYMIVNTGPKRGK